MIRSKWKPVCIVIFIFLLSLVLFAAVPVLASENSRASVFPAQNPTPSPGLQPGGSVTLTGQLSVIHGDPQPAANLPPQLIILLTATDGTVHELIMDPATALSLDRQLVQVEGRVTSTGEFSIQQAGSTVIEVLSIKALDEVEPSAEAISGSKPWINVLCRFADITATPHVTSWYTGLFGSAYPGLDHYWRQISYNNLNIAGTQTLGWYKLPRARAYYIDATQYPYGADLTALAHDCTAAADPFVYFPDYAGVNLLFNSELDCCAWGGTQYLEIDGRTRMYSMTWLPPWAHEQSIIAHEMGHGFGLPHSSGPADNPPSELNIYVSQWDVMSSSSGTCQIYDTRYSCLAPGTIAYYLDISGWIPASRKRTVAYGEAATVTLERLQQPGANANFLMAKIPIRGSSTRFYTVEVRTLTGYDRNVPGKAVIIHDIDTTRISNTGPALVVDANDGNDNVNDAGARWMTGETYTDSANGVEIRVLSVGANSFSVKITNGFAPVCEEQTQIPTSECNVLKVVYQLTNGTAWTSLNGWMRSATPCSWYGVTCSNGHVVALTLNHNNLTGVIPGQLVSLPELVTLNLRSNKLSGAVPAQLGSLPKLQRLFLQNNLLIGDLPANLAQLNDTLTIADFGYNRFTASDPGVRVFLQNKDPDWAQTQTVPPTNIRVAALSNTSVRILWTPIAYTADGGYYRVYYATSPGGAYKVGCTTASKSATSCRIDGLLPNTDYYFKIRTYTSAHSGQVPLWSLSSAEVWAQMPRANPAADSIDLETLATPKLVSPASGTTTSAMPEFTWKRVARAAGYRIEIDDTPDFTSIDHTATVTNALSYLPSEPLPDGLYYWRIVALGTEGNQSIPSAAWRIRINVVPTGIPNLVEPVSATVTGDNTPTFQWEAQADANRYKLQLAHLPDFSNFVRIVNQPGVGYTAVEALADGTYHWRVSARGADGVWSDWSAPWTFTIDTAPPITETPTPTSTPLAVELPFQDSLDSGEGWTADGAWRLDQQTSHSGSAWFADSMQRGQVSSLLYNNPIDLSGSGPISLSFWVKTLLASADQFGVDLSTDSGVSWFTVHEQSGTVGDWALTTVDLTPYLGQFVLLRFWLDTSAALPDNTSTLGLWIDDVAISIAQPPTPTANPTTETPTVTPTETVTTSTPNPETPTVVPTDLIEPTETSTPTSTPLPVELPFVETFDSGQNWLPAGAWQLDLQTVRSGASWFVNSTQRNQISTLTYSGQIDLRTALNPQLSFWQKMDLSSSDLFTFEISLDSGITWQMLDQQIGQVQDWTWHTLDLTAYRGQIVGLRFRLDTMNALPVDGVTVGAWIDDLLVQDTLPTPTPTLITLVPSEIPSPTPLPTETPISTPTDVPTELPTSTPTETPTSTPTETATSTPTDTPTEVPTETLVPTES